MTKQKTLRRISVAVVAILLITMSLLCVTLAKYTSSVSGDLTGSAKTWIIKVGTSAEQTDIKEMTELSLPDDLKAEPGMKDYTYDIVLKNEGETAATYEVKLGNALTTPTNMEVKLSDNASGTLAATNGEVTVTVTISWPYETGDDATDTEEEGMDISIPVTVTATQVKPQAD